jgi:sulfoxide reductase heme-binding subunit YedZ
VTTLLAAGGPRALWYLTRASGVVALLLLTSTTLIGVLTATRWKSTRWPRFAVAGLHRNLTLLALVFVATHVATTIADGYAPIGLRDAFVPFVSRYRPVWLGLGALALDLLLAITVTSLLRRHIGYRAWRALHWAAYAAWPLALVHGLGAGSDARFGWMATLSFACLALVAIAAAVRLVRSGRPGLQLAAGAAVVGLAIGLGAWYAGGPAKRGWAARAGTPASLLKAGGTSTSAATRRLAASTSVVSAPVPFGGRLVGRMSTSGPDAQGAAAVAVALAVRGDVPGLIHLTLWGTALDGGGIAMQESKVAYEDATTGVVSTGSVVGLDGDRVVADVVSATGARLRLFLTLHIDAEAGTVTGSVHATRVGESE